MKVKWLVVMDRDENESASKSSISHSAVETGDMLIKRFEEQFIKPEIEVLMVGMGHALSAYLSDKNVPHTKRECVCERVGSADVYKGEA